MSRRLPALNLTALLAFSAFADLALYRVLNAAFLPSHPSTFDQRLLVNLGSFASNLSGVLGLPLAVGGLLRGLSSDQVFPRSLRITVSTIGVFFCVLAAMGVLWLGVGPRYQIHLRISHSFLVLFLMLGVWRGPRSVRAKVATTLFALPIVLEAAAVFCQRMSWARLEPGEIVRVAHALTWVAMGAAPVLLAPPVRRARQLAWAVVSAATLGAGLGAAVALRFDVVQTIAFYGLHVDLTGLGSFAEQLYAAVLVVAFACLGSAALSCLMVDGHRRLVGWGLLLLAASSQDLSSPKTALFTLCGLLAVALGSARAEPPAIPDLPAEA
jgi:hypothetical protein